MKITETKLTRLEITEVERLDPIRVTLEDVGPGAGRIAFECYGTAWSVYWGAMGDNTIAEFFASVSADYIADKAHGGSRTEVDCEAVEAALKREIIRARRAGEIKKWAARSQWLSTAGIGSDGAHQLFVRADGDMMVATFGDDWRICLPERHTNAYTYCMHVIRAVQEGLKQWMGSKREEVAA